MSAIPARPNWLLLRGLVREQRHWGTFPALLAEGTRSRVLTLDLPGVGTERGRKSPTTIPGIVDDIRARFLALRAVLVSLLALVFAPDPVARERRTLALVSNTDVGRANAEAFAEYVRTAPAGPDVLVRQLLAAARFRAPSRLAVPITVLCSDGDRLCNPVVSRALATRLHAPLLVHPTGGHDLPLDDPEWVVRVLSELG